MKLLTLPSTLFRRKNFSFIPSTHYFGACVDDRVSFHDVQNLQYTFYWHKTVSTTWIHPTSIPNSPLPFETYTANSQLNSIYLKQFLVQNFVLLVEIKIFREHTICVISICITVSFNDYSLRFKWFSTYFQKSYLLPRPIWAIRDLTALAENNMQTFYRYLINMARLAP